MLLFPGPVVTDPRQRAKDQSVTQRAWLLLFQLTVPFCANCGALVKQPVSGGAGAQDAATGHRMVSYSVCEGGGQGGLEGLAQLLPA